MSASSTVTPAGGPLQRGKRGEKEGRPPPALLPSHAWQWQAHANTATLVPPRRTASSQLTFAAHTQDWVAAAGSWLNHIPAHIPTWLPAQEEGGLGQAGVAAEEGGGG